MGETSGQHLGPHDDWHKTGRRRGMETTLASGPKCQGAREFLDRRMRAAVKFIEVQVQNVVLLSYR